MSKIVLSSPASGTATFTVAAPVGSTDRTLTLPDNSGTVLTSASNLAGVAGVGKVLQVVRATDATERTTTSTSFVDAGISVTITPQKADSAILLIYSVFLQVANDGQYMAVRITDSSNNAISGAQQSELGALSAGAFLSTTFTLIGYVTPATTSATTYKARFLSFGGSTVTLRNNVTTGQLFAIEVAA